METINENGLDFIRFPENINYDSNVNDFHARALNLSRKYTPDNIEKAKVKNKI